MSILVVDNDGLTEHLYRTLPFIPEDARAALLKRAIPFWEKEVARRTGPTYYMPADNFLDAIEAIYCATRENIICLTGLESLALSGHVVDVYTPGPELLSVERWTTAAAKRVLGMDPRWYAEYLECGDKRQARKMYNGRWSFLSQPRETIVAASELAQRTPNRLLNVEGAVYTTVVTEEDLDEVIDIIMAAREFAFDTETTGLHPIDADLVGIGIACDTGRAYYIPVGHDEGEQLPMWYVLERLKPIFEDPTILKYGHKLPFDVNFIETHSDIVVRGIAGDSKTVAWMLGYGATYMVTREQDGEKLGLKALAYNELGVRMMDFATTTAGKSNAAAVYIDKMTPYAAADSDMTLRLIKKLTPRLTPELYKRYTDIELPFLRTVSNMERRGVYIDTKLVQELGNQYVQETWEILELLKAQTHAETFNPNSPRQVGDYLFKVLGLPPVGGKTKTGFKADAQTLEKLRHLHPVVDQLMELKQIQTIISRYTSALPEMVSPVTGRVHGLISATGTATGRVAMADPNLMNIPVRTERGAKLRYAFIAQGNNYLLQADYSQIEPRVLAHLSGDPFLIATFEAGIDLYRAIGGRVWNCDPTDVTGDQRKALKMAWLAATYLVGAEKLAAQLTVALKKRWTPQEARDFLVMFFDVVPNVRAFQQESIAKAYETGYAETMLGFRVPIPGIRSNIPEIKAHAHSQAVNLPIQGTASGDIVKLAMNQIEAELPGYMILQIHDELLLEGSREDLERIAPQVQHIMENVVALRVPLEAKPVIAKSWGEAKGD